MTYPSNSFDLGSFLINEGVPESLQAYHELVRDNDLLARRELLMRRKRLCEIQVEKRIPRKGWSKGVLAKRLRAVSLQQIYHEKMWIDTILLKKSNKVSINFLRNHVSFDVNYSFSKKSGNIL